MRERSSLTASGNFRIALVALALALLALFPTPAQAAPTSRDYVYDLSGRLSKVMDADGTLVTYAYDAVGNITKIGRDKVDPDFNVVGTLPLTGGAGDVVTIQGHGFDSNLVGNEVTIGGVAATVVSVDAAGRKLVVKVPWEAETGPIAVTVGGKTTTAPDQFTIVHYGDVGIRGTLAPGETATYPLELVLGQTVLIRAAQVSNATFYPKIVVNDPSAKQVATAQGATVAGLIYTATTSGTFQIVVSDASGQNVGTDFVLYYTVAPGSNEGGALDPKSPIDGTLDLGDLDSFTFEATAGQNVQLRVTDLAASTLYPYIAVYGPSGALVQQAGNYDVAALSFATSVAGRYTVVVLDASNGAAATGDYKIYFTQVPGSNEGGALDPTSPIDGTIDRGDLDSYTFDVEAGAGVQLRVADVGATTLYPYLVVYDPNGAIVKQVGNYDVAALSFTPSVAGKYSVVVFDGSNSSAATGDYKIYFSLAPGSNEGGALDPTSPMDGTIDRGDLDSYTFDVAAGVGVQLRVTDVGATGLYPYVVVYDPNGAIVKQVGNYDVAALSFTPSVAGRYTAVVFDGSNGAEATGDYKIYYTKAPDSNEGGALDPTSPIDGTIDRGDLDAYTFNVESGVGVQLRVTDVGATGLYPYVVVYDPNGAIVKQAGNYDVAALSFTPSVSGKYTVVVFDGSNGSEATGDYKLYFTEAPGSNEGGALDPTSPIDGTIDRGDLDSYTFEAASGVAVQLRVTDVGATGLYPYLIVYDSNGAAIKQAGNYDVAALSFTPSVAGKYTVVVFDGSNGAEATGDYKLYFTEAPGSSEGGALDPTSPIDGTIDRGDLDSYTFDAQAGVGVQVRVADVGASGLYPYVVVYGPSGALVKEAGAYDVAALSFTPATTGKYTVVVFDASSGSEATGAYKLYFTQAPGSNEGGLLSVGTPATGTIDLGDLDSFTFTAQAGDKLKLVATDTSASTFVPYVAIYGPTGTNVVNASGADTATASFTATAAGTYTAVLFDASAAYASTGSYSLLLTLN